MPKTPHVVDMKHGLDIHRSPYFIPKSMADYSRGRELTARQLGQFEEAVLWQQLADHCESLT